MFNYKKINKPKMAIIVGMIAAIVTSGQARMSIKDTYTDNANNKASFRQLITDCAERSISLSCHRAGIYYIKERNEIHEGMLYLRNACELGRGYSCTVLGNMYTDKKDIKYNYKYAKTFYNQGCLRGSEEGCIKWKKLEKPVEKNFFQKLFE